MGMDQAGRYETEFIKEHSLEQPLSRGCFLNADKHAAEKNANVRSAIFPLRKST